MSDDTPRARGEAILSVLNPDSAAAQQAALAEIAPEVSAWVTEFAYGTVYARPGLGLKERELVTVAALAAMGHTPAQLRAHLRAARRAGWSQAELIEALMQLTVYAGFPAAINALMIARAEFAEEAQP
ncbi:carboxymuconolactone decarboxylase family protein [Halothiobacillus sp. DCM-1]|uniref:carboxymuconolactone decarboxylase family protein n=1 Tax=Halothiobacillus sp. DCM-1 TaxID=3112558 RepID=UPI003248FFBB